MRKVLLVLTLMYVGVSHAQTDLFGPETTSKRTYVERKAFIGIGLGLEYGAIGGNLSIRPTPRLKVHGGCGYNFVGLGYSAGAGFRLMPKQRVCVTIGGMYGSNAVILVQGLEQYNEIYYGLTFTSTIELHGKYSNSHWSFGLNIPFRSPEFWTDWGRIQDNPAIQVQQAPLPLSITVGYNFGL